MSDRKIALVTGGSRGIGRAICIELAEKGCDVLINYVKNQEQANKTLELVKAKGVNAELLKFNASDYSETQQAIKNWKESNPEKYISILINNAGIRRDNLMLWLSREDWNEVIDVNLNGFFYVTQPLLKDMIIAKWGRIINVVSVSGLKGLPGQANYSAAKGGLISATKVLAQEIGRKGVTVNAVAPGFISTDMTSDLDEAKYKSMIPVGRFGQPEEVAKLVGFLASDDSSYITGEVISINGGIY